MDDTRLHRRSYLSPQALFFIFGIYQATQSGWFFQSVYVFASVHGFTLADMPYISLLAVPYTLKWLFAPFSDYLTHYKWTYGDEIRWLLRLSGISWLALSLFYRELHIFFWSVMILLPHIAICLDNSIDAFRIHDFADDMQVLLLRANVLGYRLGIGFLTGFIVLSSQWIPWWCWFIIIALCALCVSLSIDPMMYTAQKKSSLPHIKAPSIFSWRVLLAAVLIRSGDAWVCGSLILYLIHHHHWNSYDIGTMYQMTGGLAAMFGAFIAPYFLQYYRLETMLSRGLIVGSILTIIWIYSLNFTYYTLIYYLVLWNIWVGFYALFFSQWLTEHTSHSMPGTHFSLLSSLARTPGLLSAWTAGILLTSSYKSIMFIMALGGYLASYIALYMTHSFTYNTPKHPKKIYTR